MYKKQTKRFITAVVLLLLTEIAGLNAQPWLQNNNIFNPSGVPSLPFSQPRFADLDADGDLDLILGNLNDKPFYMENTGTAVSPIFVTGTDIFENVSSLNAEMAVFKDIDNDGDLDFIGGGFMGVTLYLNFGTAYDPFFMTPDTLLFADLNTGSSPAVDMADIDYDGDLDVVAGFSESGLLKIYLNSGTPESPVFHEIDSETVGDVGLYAYPNFCDIDADGDEDLLVGRDAFGFVCYLNAGDSVSAVWQTYPGLFYGQGTDTYWNSPELADLNGDGRYDLIYGTASGPLKYYKNSGTVTDAAWRVNTTLFGGVIDVGGASSPVFYDFDNDGDLDMITGTQMGDIKYYRNKGNAFGPAWEESSTYFSSIDHSIYSAVAIGDVNNDSLPDAIIGDLSGNLYYHRNTGSGFMQETAVLTDVNLGGWSVPRLIDVDSDGDLDIVAGNEDGNLAYIENQGSASAPVWAMQSGYFGSLDVGSNCVPTICDLDGDGDLDILTGDMWGEIQYFENREGEFVEADTLFSDVAGSQNATPALVDLDGDGDADLVLGNYDGTFSYYENRRLVIMSVQSGHNPEAFTLFPAFPNPFNPIINIRYATHVISDITLLVYDIRGREIYSEKTPHQQPGEHSIRWNAGNYASGIYIIALSDGKNNLAVKAQLLK